MNKLFTLMALLIAVFTSRCDAQQRVVLPEHERGVALVKAEVTNVEKTDNGATTISTLKISHVYSQPTSSNFLGRTFQVQSNFYVGSGPGLGVSPVPTPGEQGLWTLADGEHGLTIGYAIGRRLGGYEMFYPVRRRVPSGRYQFYVPVSFAQAETLAQFIESITKSNAVTSILLLKSQVLYGTPLISSWSIQTLGRLLNKKEAVEFFRTLTSERTFEGQIEIDKELTRLEGKTWQESLQRQAMLARWTVDFSTDDEMSRLMAYFRDSDNISSQLEADLAKTIIQRSDISVASFKNVAYFVSSSFLLSEMMRQPYEEYKIAAAEALRRFKLTPEQLDIIKALLAKEKNSILRQTFQSILMRNVLREKRSL